MERQQSFPFRKRARDACGKGTLLFSLVATLLAGGTALVHAQFSVDSFDPNANSQVFSVVVQPNGQVLISGQFNTLSPNGGAAVARTAIARLNSDGTLDTAFNVHPDGYIRAIALQADGKIVIGGDFNHITPPGGSAVMRMYIARLNADGTLDLGFDPWATASVHSLVVQPDGKILVGGGFNHFYPNASSPGFTRNRIARLDSTGVPDSFDPNVTGGAVMSLALQPDGKVIAGGSFTSIGGQARTNLARMDGTTGAVDSWNPNANALVQKVVLQPDGKILAGGDFSSYFSTPTIGGQTRNHIARLDPTTGLADTWDPNANNSVTAIALQADGKILVGGAFGVGTSIGGQSRFRIARLDAVTGLADSFDPNVSNGSSVNTIAVQPDGKILIGGAFATLSPNGGAAVTRNCVARLEGLILNIQRSAANIVLSWGTNFTSYTLETSTNLNTTNWSAVSPAPVVSGSKNVVTNEFTNSTRFYRLRK